MGNLLFRRTGVNSNLIFLEIDALLGRDGRLTQGQNAQQVNLAAHELGHNLTWKGWDLAGNSTAHYGPRRDVSAFTFWDSLSVKARSIVGDADEISADIIGDWGLGGNDPWQKTLIRCHVAGTNIGTCANRFLDPHPLSGS